MSKATEYWLEKLWNRLSGGADSLGVDSTTNALEIIDYAHHEIHSGSHFFVSGYTELDTDGVTRFSVTTPNTTVWLHMTWVITGSKGFSVTVHEDCAVSGGTPVGAVNSNRNSPNVSDATILQNPTVDGGGSLIASSKFGSTGTPRYAPTGGSETRDSEIILKQNSTYLWTITSDEDTNVLSYAGSWYEHVNK